METIRLYAISNLVWIKEQSKNTRDAPPRESRTGECESMQLFAMAQSTARLESRFDWNRGVEMVATMARTCQHCGAVEDLAAPFLNGACMECLRRKSGIRDAPPAFEQGEVSEDEPAGEVSCPFCDHQIRSDVRMLGQTVICPGCNAQVHMPNWDEQSLSEQEQPPSNGPIATILGGLVLLGFLALVGGIFKDAEYPDFVVYRILPILSGLIIWVIIDALVGLPGALLQRRFVSLGNLRGRMKSDIEAAVGPPNSTSSASDGRLICQWMAAGYHVALVFDGPKCLGVSHEAVA